MDDSLGKVGDYSLSAFLSKGAQGYVYSATNAAGEKIALKVIPHSMLREHRKALQNMQKEASVLNQLREEAVAHHIVCAHKIEADCEAVVPNIPGGPQKVVCMEMVFCDGGALFDYVVTSKQFPEKVARTYSRQLLDALAWAHSKSVYHRDIKPENVLVTRSYNLALADWGMAAWNEHTDRGGMLRTRCGTSRYMAPEVYHGLRYSGGPADVWSAGIIIFLLLHGIPPFDVPEKSNAWFNLLLHRRWDLFWSCHLRFGAPDVSPAAKSLIQGLLAVEPSERLTAEAALAHEFFTGPHATPEELADEMLSRIGTSGDVAEESTVGGTATAVGAGTATVASAAAGSPAAGGGGAAAGGGGGAGAGIQTQADVHSIQTASTSAVSQESMHDDMLASPGATRSRRSLQVQSDQSAPVAAIGDADLQLPTSAPGAQAYLARRRQALRGDRPSAEAVAAGSAAVMAVAPSAVAGSVSASEPAPIVPRSDLIFPESIPIAPLPSKWITQLPPTNFPVLSSFTPADVFRQVAASCTAVSHAASPLLQSLYGPVKMHTHFDADTTSTAPDSVLNVQWRPVRAAGAGDVDAPSTPVLEVEWRLFAAPADSTDRTSNSYRLCMYRRAGDYDAAGLIFEEVRRALAAPHHTAPTEHPDVGHGALTGTLPQSKSAPASTVPLISLGGEVAAAAPGNKSLSDLDASVTAELRFL